MVASHRKRRLPNYEVVGKRILSGISYSFKLRRVMVEVGYPRLLFCAENRTNQSALPEQRLSRSRNRNPYGRARPRAHEGKIENRPDIHSIRLLLHSKSCVFRQLWISPERAIHSTRELFTPAGAAGRVILEQHLGEG
jgi:hypothetical protein